MSIRVHSTVPPILAILLLASACAPDYVDEVQPLASTSAYGGGRNTEAADLDLPQGEVLSPTRKPGQVVEPLEPPDVVAQPDNPVLVTPIPNRIPPRPPAWPSPPPNYNAARPDAVPLGIPNRPPAAWRY